MEKNYLSIRSILSSLMALLLINTYSCVTEYTPSGVEETSGFLVVEGTITNEITNVRLTRTIGISEENFTGELKMDVVTDADLYVECDDGTQFRTATYIGEGRYSIATGMLDANKKYRLYISADGNEYHSEYLSPIYTPEIDDLALIKDEPGAPVRLCVSTHDSPDKPRYYKWTYNEIWEVHAAHFANAGHVNGPGAWCFDNRPGIGLPCSIQSPIEYYDINTPKNIYHCWGRDTSRTILIGSTEKLSENVITKQELKKMELSDDRISVLYYVRITQNQLRKEAYDYFYGLQKNTEQTGGLYPPMPTNYRGNIQCLNEPDRYVVGFIEVSITTFAERFFYTSLYELPPASSFCDVESYNAVLAVPDKIYGFALHTASKDENGKDHFQLVARGTCVDCRTKEKASKNRPDFWPTSNY